MSYRLVVLGDLPLAYWRLEETTGTTAADLSGFVFNGTYTGTPIFNRPGLTAAGRSALFTGTVRFSATVPDVLVSGQENVSCAIECWTKPLAAPTARRHIAGRAGAGIMLTPGGVEFSIPSSDGNTYTAYYTVTDWSKPLHIVANYVGRNLGLIVNGEEGTNVDFFGNFVNTSTAFLVGGSTTTSATDAYVDDVAVYRRALSIRDVTRHYDYGRMSVSPFDLAQVSAGTYYSFDDSTADVAWKFVEKTPEDFSRGIVDNLSFTGDYLIATDGDGTHTTDIEYVGSLGSVAGSRVDWEASASVVVEVSLDMGTTWTACTNHAQIPGIAPGTDLTGLFIQFRKRFVTAGLDYEPRFDKFRAVIYTSKVVNANFDSPVGVYGNPTLAEDNWNPLENVTHMGITFSTGSYLVIPPGEGGTRTLEFWYKRNADTNGEWQYILDTRSSTNTGGLWFAIHGTPPAVSVGTGTVYVNGVAKAPVIADFPIGVWVHVVIVLPATSTDPIYLNSRYNAVESGTHSIAHLTLSPLALTAREVGVRYNMATGGVNRSIVDSTIPALREYVPGIKAYSFAWAGEASGLI